MEKFKCIECGENEVDDEDDVCEACWEAGIEDEDDEEDE